MESKHSENFSFAKHGGGALLLPGSDETDYKLVPRLTIANNSAEIFSVQFSPDGAFLAAGCGDGALRIFNATTGQLAYNLQGGSNLALPTTALRFRPVTATTRTKNVLLAANAAGTVQHWHMTSGKLLHAMSGGDDSLPTNSLFSHIEPTTPSNSTSTNQVYALDYSPDGAHFVTAGKDTILRIYDEATKSLVSSLRGGSGFSSRTSPGHSNRVFSVKYCPMDPNMIISGGWDNTVQIWDSRAGHSVRSIYGPHICGDSLDMVDDHRILTGSWRPDHALQMWDFRSTSLMYDIPWHAGESDGSNSPAPCMLYAASFSKEGSGRFIAAGGSGANEAKVFDTRSNNALVGTVTGLPRGVFSLDFAADSQRIAIAGGDAAIRIYDIVPRN